MGRQDGSAAEAVTIGTPNSRPALSTNGMSFSVKMRRLDPVWNPPSSMAPTRLTKIWLRA